MGGAEGNRTPDLFHAKEARSRCATAPRVKRRAARRRPAIEILANAARFDNRDAELNGGALRFGGRWRDRGRGAVCSRRAWAGIVRLWRTIWRTRSSCRATRPFWSRWRAPATRRRATPWRASRSWRRAPSTSTRTASRRSRCGTRPPAGWTARLSSTRWSDSASTRCRRTCAPTCWSTWRATGGSSWYAPTTGCGWCRTTPRCWSRSRTTSG